MAKSNSFVGDVCVAMLGICALLSFFSFVLGYPWNQSGMWRQTEMASAAFYGLTAVTVALLATLSIIRDKDTIVVLTSPFILLFGAFCLVGFTTAPFIDHPMRSIHGTMKHGAGAIWYFELFALTVSIAVLQQKGWMRAVFAGGVVSSTAILLSYQFPGIVGIPLGFVEWSGIGAGLIALIALLNLDNLGRLKWVAIVASIGLIYWGYEVSDNRTILLCALAALAWFALLRIPGLSTLLDRKAFRACVITAIAIVGMVAVYASGPVIERYYDVDAGARDAATVLSNNASDQVAIHEKGLGTIWSRSYLVRVLVDDLVRNPAALLTGHGWGGFEDAYERNARELPGRAFFENIPSASRIYWDGHHKANFHSHNMGVEVLYSVGIGGLALWLAMFAVLAFQSRKGFYVAFAFTVYGTFWFPVNHITGFMALALAIAVCAGSVGRFSYPIVVGCVEPVLLKRHRSANRSETIISGLAPLGYVVTIALLILAVMFGKIIRMETFERGFSPSMPNNKVETCGLYRTAFFPENEITWALYTLLNRKVVNSKDPAQAVYDNTSSFVNITCMIRRYSLEKPDAVTLALSLKTRGQLVALGNKTFGALTDDIRYWGDDIDKFLQIAPKRTEFLAPYINTLAQRSRGNAVKEIERYLPRLQDADPIKHYLLYMKSALGNDRDGMKNHMQTAVDLGFGNLWKVTPAMIKEFDLK